MKIEKESGAIKKIKKLYKIIARLEKTIYELKRQNKKPLNCLSEVE